MISLKKRSDFNQKNAINKMLQHFFPSALKMWNQFIIATQEMPFPVI